MRNSRHQRFRNLTEPGRNICSKLHEIKAAVVGCLMATSSSEPLERKKANSLFGWPDETVVNALSGFVAGSR